MPQRVVDLLEIVEIEENHRHVVVRAISARQRMRHAILKKCAIAEPCQRIVQCLMSQVLLERHPFGHVPNRQHDAAHVDVGQQIRGHGFRAHPVTVGAHHPAPDVTGGQAAHQRGREVRLVGAAICFVYQFSQRAIHHPFSGVAKNSFRRGTHVPDDAELVEDGEDIRRVLHEGAEACFGLLLRLLDVESHVLAYRRQLPRHHQYGQYHRAHHQIGDAV